MPASAILSPVTPTLASSSAGATVNASGTADDFAARLESETAEATLPTPASPALASAIGAIPNTTAPVEPIVVEALPEDTQVSAAEGNALPIWLQVLPPIGPVVATAASEAVPGATAAPQANIRESVGNTAGIDLSSLPDPDITPSELDVAAAAAPVAETALATTPITPVPNRAFAEAALANLRALPGAGALQQATISQRKTDTTTISNVIDDGGSISSSDARTSALAAPASSTSAWPPIADLKIAPEGPLAETASDIIEILPQTSDPDTVALTTSTSVPTGSATATSTDTSLSSLSRATIETTTALAAQITSRLAGRSTRFELGLTPEGLGRVDVTLDIDADGQLAARLAFDNPLAATELRGRADELRRQLEDAGFTLARDALDFSSRDNPSGGGTDRRQHRASAYADRHAAQADFTDAPPAWALSPSSRLTPQGVDVKV